MLDIPDVRLGSDPAVNRALHHSVARVLVTMPLLQRLAARGLMVTLLAGGAAILPGIGMLLAGRAPALAGAGSGVVATGVCFAPFTTVRYQGGWSWRRMPHSMAGRSLVVGPSRVREPDGGSSPDGS